MFNSNDGHWLMAKSVFKLILATAVLGIVGCTDKSDNGALQDGQAAMAVFSPNEEDPQWVSRDPNKPSKIAVVFVHGIFGSTKGTWTTENGTTFFQLLKADPEVGSRIDIYAFGFESKMFGDSGSLDVREGANKLRTYLSGAGVLDYPAVVFVGHSMGGLVVLRYLTSDLDKDSSLSAKVPLVVLFGSPQEGAQIASVAKLALSNAGLAHMRPADDNQWLQQLTDDWTNLTHKPQVVCGYEKMPTFGVLIVPWSSSNRFCTEPGLAIDGADHISMVKPDRPAHPSVMLLTDAMRRHVLPKQFGGRLETPDFERRGDDWHFVMDSVAKNARILNIGTADIKYWFAEKSDPALYLVPDEGPATVVGNSSQNVKFLLLANAKANQYSFHLKTSMHDDRRVIVDVPDLDRLRQQMAVLSRSILRDLNQHLAKYETTPISAGQEQKSPVVLASVAYKSVEKNLPGLPSSATWVITADALSAASLNKIAIEALRKAEAVSIDAVRSTSVQDVATRILFKTEEQQIFRNVPMQKLPGKQGGLESTPLDRLPHDAGVEANMRLILKDSASSSRTSLELAERMKRVPSLAGSGFILEGEVQSASGDAQAADIAFKKAFAIEPTPALQQRIGKP